MRSVMLSLLAVLIGGAMVAGGVWGLIDSLSDDDGDSAAQAATPRTSPAGDCAQVAERDPRFRRPHDLSFGGEGKATVRCDGSSVTFSIEIGALRNRTFYEVVLERGKRTEDIGSILSIGPNDVNTVTVDTRAIRTRKYDFLTVRVDDFHSPGQAGDPPFRAPL